MSRQDAPASLSAPPVQSFAAVSEQVELDQLFNQNVALVGHDRPGHLVEQPISEELPRPMKNLAIPDAPYVPFPAVRSRSARSAAVKSGW